MKGESESVTEANAIRTHGNRIRKIYQFGAVLIAVALLSSASTLIVFGSTPSDFPTVLEPGSLVTTADYIVFVDGSIYKARDGKTGSIAYDSASLSTLFISMYSALALVGGGEIFIMSGEYSSDTSLKPTANTHTTGTGDASEIIFTSYFGVEINQDNVRFSHLAFTGSGPAMHGIGSGAGVSHLEISSCTFYGVDDDAIVLHGTDYSLVQNNYIYECGEGINVKGGDHHTITNNNIHDVTGGVVGNGIEIRYNGDPYDPISNVIVTGNQMQDISIGILVIGGVSNILIDSNIICSSTTGIALSGLSNQSFDDIVITNNIIEETTNGIAFSTATWNDIIIAGNIISDISNFGVVVDTKGIGISIKDNCFSDLDATVGQAHIRFTKGDHVSICGNTFINFTNKHGIWLTEVGQALISDNFLKGSDNATFGINGIRVADSNLVLDGNFIENCTRGVYIDSQNNVTVSNSIFKNCTYAIVTAGTADYTTIIGNSFGSMIVAPLVLTGTHNTIKFNTGYITENSGIATITGATTVCVVNHGLDLVVKLVLLTGNNTGIGYYFATALTTTQFVITFQNAPGAATWTFYWYAQTW